MSRSILLGSKVARFRFMWMLNRASLEERSRTVSATSRRAL